MVQPFKHFLEERFINLIGDDPRKHEHKDELHGLLTRAYEKIGGIHGSGFSSPDDMVKNIPMWKIHKDSSTGKITSAVLYKDKEGRKSVAVATDGSETSKKRLSDMMTQDMTRNRAYSEKSGPSLSFLKRNLPPGHITKFAIPRDKVAKISGEEIRQPPSDDPEVLKHPELKDHFYQRKIGNEWHTKVMLGTPGKKITNK